MPVIAFTTFLKCLGQTTPEKARQYARYQEPGGYDYYRPLKGAAGSVTWGGKEVDDVAAGIQKLSSNSERLHNTEGLKRLTAWLQKRPKDYFEPPKAIYKSPSGTLSIKVNPEFGITLGAKKMICAVWYTREPKLTGFAAGVGVYMMNAKLRYGNYSDCSFHILDLRANRLYGANSVPNDAEEMLKLEFAVADQLLIQTSAA